MPMIIDQRLNMIQQAQDELREMHEDFRRGGGGGGGDMERRIERLEDKVDSLDQRLGDRVGKVEQGLATLAERVAHLPSKGFIVQSLIASLAVVAGLIAFGEKLQALVR
jgi:hypothetical protein